jgi:hypothetical protein
MGGQPRDSERRPSAGRATAADWTLRMWVAVAFLGALIGTHYLLRIFIGN